MEDAFHLIHEPDGRLIVGFDQTVYSLSAVKKAAYKYSDSFEILIQQNAKCVDVLLTPKQALTKATRNGPDFCNEVLDQQLREEIGSETAAIRNVLLAHAFSKTGLL